MKKKKVAKLTSPALRWINDHEGILNKQGLERFLGIPRYSLAKFFSTGYFATRWLSHLEAKMQALQNNDYAVLQSYIRGRLLALKKIEQYRDDRNIKRPIEQQFLNRDSQAQQIINDLKALQDILVREKHPLRYYLFEKMQTFMGGAAEIFSPTKR